MAAVFEIVVAMVPGLDVLRFSAILHWKWENGIGVIVIHDKYVLVAIAGNVGKTSCEVGVGFVGWMEGVNHDVVGALSDDSPFIIVGRLIIAVS